MARYGKSERRGMLWLLVVVLAVTGLGLAVRHRTAENGTVADTQVVYRTVTDTVYRERKSRKHKSHKNKRDSSHADKANRKRPRRDSQQLPPRDFLNEPVPIRNR